MRERIRQVMARTFRVPEKQMPANPSVNELLEWDSLRHLELMLGLETEFAVHISIDTMLELLSLKDIQSYLENQGVPA